MPYGPHDQTRSLTTFGPDCRAGLAAVTAMLCVSGLLVGATSPLALELAAQVTYPIPEGVSANLMTNVTTQLASIAFLALCASSSFPDSAATLFMGLLIVCCTLAAGEPHQLHRRTCSL